MSVAPVSRHAPQSADAAERRARLLQQHQRQTTPVADPAPSPAAPTVVEQTIAEDGGLLAEGAKAAIAYRGTMYGEIGVGNRTLNFAPEMRFGTIKRESTLAERSYTSRVKAYDNYGIDDFSRTNGRGTMARNTMVSSQATVNYGKKVAADLNLPERQIQFEVPRGTGKDVRQIDVRHPDATGQPVSTEVKAASDIKRRQLGKDIAAAKAGDLHHYVFTDNPNGTARGPSVKAQAQLADAAAQTGGRITSSYQPDIAPSASTLKAVELSSTASKTVRGIGKVAAPVGLVMDTVSIGTAIQKDGGNFGKNTKVAVTGAAGGWAGAAGGAAAGAKVGALVGMLGGPAGAAIGAVAGGIIGGIAGGIGGASIGEALGKLW